VAVEQVKNFKKNKITKMSKGTLKFDQFIKESAGSKDETQITEKSQNIDLDALINGLEAVKKQYGPERYGGTGDLGSGQDMDPFDRVIAKLKSFK
jgi:hypothetical protein